MKIYACLIVKDDEETKQLSNALDSIKPYVDGIFVTATGEKVEGIKKLCKDNDIAYSYFKWIDDFAAARTFNFQQAPDDADYIFWMDSDDILVGGQYLREIAEVSKKTGKDVVFLEYWYACRFKGDPSVANIDQVELVHHRERLIRPGTIHWTGRLHESPLPKDGTRHRYTNVTYKEPYDFEKGQFPIAVAHMAEAKDAIENMERNRRILELQLKDERDKGEADPRTLLYLMKIYAESGEAKLQDECLKMGEEYLKKSGWDEERGTCWELMGQVWGNRGDNRKAIDCFHSAIREWPYNVLFYVRLATAYFNIEDYRNARHWLEVSMKLDMNKKFTSGIVNYHAVKAMASKLMVKLAYNVDKDVDRAFEAAQLVYKEVPTKENLEELTHLENAKRLNDACKSFHKYLNYLDDIGEENKIVPALNTAPSVIQEMPFAQNIRKKFASPRRWDDNEICYYASFNKAHFFKWDSSSLDHGVGGSETAVIKLAKEWADMGYKVTVYGDPIKKGIQYFNGESGASVTYLPYYYFNIKDYFSTFLQWRGWQLAEIVKCKRFYVDLHDIFNAVDISANQLNNIDKIMVKSAYQRNLAPTIPDSKFLIIPHGL